MNNPSPDKMRIACAEVCGFTNINTHCWRGHLIGYERSVPDYPQDINAVVEALRGTTDKVLQSRFSDALVQILNRAHDGEFRFIGATPFHVASATALQYLEAFLRVMKPELFSK